MHSPVHPVHPPKVASGDADDDLSVHVGRAVGGDPRALTLLAGRLLPRVRNLVRYLIRGDADVDDVAQEALLAVFRGLPTYQGQGSLTSWADRVTARATFAWLKRRRRSQEQLAASRSLDQAAGEVTAPDDFASRRQIVLLLDQLPLEQRSALVLHHVVGLSVPEIARETGVGVETVRTRLRLARARLRQTEPQDDAEEASHVGV